MSSAGSVGSRFILTPEKIVRFFVFPENSEYQLGNRLKEIRKVEIRRDHRDDDRTKELTPRLILRETVGRILTKSVLPHNSAARAFSLPRSLCSLMRVA